MITDNSGQLCLVYLHDHIAQTVRTAVRMRVVDSNRDNLSLPFMSDVSEHCYALSGWCTLFLLWNKHHVTITYIIVVLCLLLALCLSLCLPLFLPSVTLFHSSLSFSHSLTFSPLSLPLSPSFSLSCYSQALSMHRKLASNRKSPASTSSGLSWT